MYLCENVYVNHGYRAILPSLSCCPFLCLLPRCSFSFLCSSTEHILCHTSVTPVSHLWSSRKHTCFTWKLAIWLCWYVEVRAMGQKPSENIKTALAASYRQMHCWHMVSFYKCQHLFLDTSSQVCWLWAKLRQKLLHVGHVWKPSPSTMPVMVASLIALHISAIFTVWVGKTRLNSNVNLTYIL